MKNQLIIFISLFSLCACIDTFDEYVQNGVVIPERTESEESWLIPSLITGLKAKRTQSENVIIDVFAGYNFDFYENWKHNLYGEFDSDSTFCIYRVISSETYKQGTTSILLSDVDLSDFDNKEKYEFYFEKKNGKNGNGLTYNFSFKDSFLIDEIPYEKGSISYEFYVKNNVGNISQPIKCLQYYHSLMFVKNKSNIEFADYYTFIL